MNSDGHHMVGRYLKILESLDFQEIAFLEYQKQLQSFTPKTLEDTFAWVTCVLALKAASRGNLGVGAVLVKDNEIIHEACNEMLEPYFRSDAHPEMMVLSDYEKSNTISPGSMRTIMMFSSLEPCPMCLTRLSTTGIGCVKYIASHPGSGMANAIDKLPVLWQIFCEDLEIVESTCSDILKSISKDILNLSAKLQMPKILTYKEGVLPKDRIERFNQKLEGKN